MYRFVPESKKNELLRQIINEEYTIKEAAKKLGLNYSTAKYTVKQSKRMGRIKKVSCFKYSEVRKSLTCRPKPPPPSEIQRQRLELTLPRY